MRVGTFNQISQVYGTSGAKKKYNSNQVDFASTLDKVSFSTVGKDMQVAKTALNSVPDVRQDRVNELKAAIANGTYNVSAEDFAEKLMAAYEEKSF